MAGGKSGHKKTRNLGGFRVKTIRSETSRTGALDRNGVLFLKMSENIGDRDISLISIDQDLAFCRP